MEVSLLGKENKYSPLLTEIQTHPYLLTSVQAWGPWWDWTKERILSSTGDLSGLSAHWGSPRSLMGLWSLEVLEVLVHPGSRLPPPDDPRCPKVPHSLMKAYASLLSNQLISPVIFPLSHNSSVVCLEFQVVLCLQIPSPLRDYEHMVGSFSLFR